MLDPHAVYQLKISLKGAKPPIWRRILVPSFVNLGDLHFIIQDAMGWESAHLHEFRVGERRLGSLELHFAEYELEDEDEHLLSDVLRKSKERIDYVYDFGDRWHHEILLEEVQKWDRSREYPVCIAGKRACPPEDVGGLPGYALFLEAIADPNHPDHKQMAAWGSGDFDPEAFDLNEVNERLLSMPIALPKEKPGARRKSAAASADAPIDAQPVDPKEELPVVPSPLRMDIVMRKMGRLVDGAAYSSVDDLNRSIQAKLAEGDLDELVPNTPEEDALELVAQADETLDDERATSLVQDALKIDPQCADAYRVLADMEDDTDKRLELLEKALGIAEERLGPEFFEEHMGHFWDMVETRPYMRVRHDLALQLWGLHRHQEAIDHSWELLRLNESDRLGVRYFLINWLLTLQKVEDLGRLVERFSNDDKSAGWLYPKALYLFQRHGVSAQANQAFKEAFEANPFVVEIMAWGDESDPSKAEAEAYREAEWYVILGYEAWDKTDGAFEWLAQQVKKIITADLASDSKIGRNDPCPCGSGKKYKKCCGATV